MTYEQDVFRNHLAVTHPPTIMNQILRLDAIFKQFENQWFQLHESNHQPRFTLHLIVQLDQLIEEQIAMVRSGVPLPALLAVPCSDDLSLAAHNCRTSLIALYLGHQRLQEHNELKCLALGAMLHDVGKLKVSKFILDKPGALSAIEYRHVQTHSLKGYHLLIHESWMPEISRRIVLNHHERMDGSGYPNGLKGACLSLYDRITSVADVFDAMTGKRVYRKSMSLPDAYTAMRKECVRQLDPQVMNDLRNLLMKYGCVNQQQTA